MPSLSHIATTGDEEKSLKSAGFIPQIPWSKAGGNKDSGAAKTAGQQDSLLCCTELGLITIRFE